MRPARNLAVDFYRVSGVVLIVLGHWLAGSVTRPSAKVSANIRIEVRGVLNSCDTSVTNLARS